MMLQRVHIGMKQGAVTNLLGLDTLLQLATLLCCAWANIVAIVTHLRVLCEDYNTNETSVCHTNVCSRVALTAVHAVGGAAQAAESMELPQSCTCMTMCVTTPHRAYTLQSDSETLGCDATNACPARLGRHLRGVFSVGCTFAAA